MPFYLPLTEAHSLYHQESRRKKCGCTECIKASLTAAVELARARRDTVVSYHVRTQTQKMLTATTTLNDR